VSAIEETTQTPLAKDIKAATARKERGNGFGFGPPGGLVQAPLPRTFVEKRTASVQAQLAGKSTGYVPSGGFGPMGRPR
jgi:spore coat protein H